MAKFVLRSTALDLLVRIGETGGFSNLLIDNAIKNKKISPVDEGLLTEIIYGTLQRKMTIDYFLHPFIGDKKMEPWVKWLLYMSVYQMIYLDRIPDHAIINEAVEISKKKGHKGTASVVNGVLRNIQRKGVRNTGEITDSSERISIETSHPKWLVSRWIDMYGQEITEKMCRANLYHKPIAVRVQPLRISREQAINDLEKEEYQVRASLFSPQGIIVEKGNILRSSLFREGMLTVQDQSSMLPAEMMDVQPGQKVLDACSAPGGKTTHLAEKMKNKGKIFAYDLHEKKVDLVRKKADQLGLKIIEASQADARELHDVHPEESFDRILMDAPCSGLGVLRGKPDIKYNKQKSDIQSLSQIQLNLLNSVSSLLKKGGKLIYSTCTVDMEENEKLVEKFLANHSEFKVDDQFFRDLPEFLQDSEGKGNTGLQLFPHQFDTDGFFLTRLTKE